MTSLRRHSIALAACASCALLIAHAPAIAQAHNPFSVGIAEGGGSASGLSGWLLSKQAALELTLSGAVRAAKANGSATWMLAGLSLLYGVFHAAGPGHGKAVVASYMFANERALRRGIILSFAAAVLQGTVAIVLVGALALIFHATAQGMRNAAQIIESMSYAGIAALGAWLVWRKGTAFVAAWQGAAPTGPTRAAGSPGPVEAATEPCCAGHEHDQSPAPGHHRHDHGHAHGRHEPHPERPAQAGAAGRAASVTPEGGHVHGPGCGHYHAPDAASLGTGFKWSSALLTVVAAGLRPCSGAILVLVFALAQGIFAAGVVAVVAMSLGTAVTTSALAVTAVLAGGLAVKLAGTSSKRGILVARGLEVSAGLVILVLGLGLFLGVMSNAGA